MLLTAMSFGLPSCGICKITCILGYCFDYEHLMWIPTARVSIGPFGASTVEWYWFLAGVSSMLDIGFLLLFHFLFLMEVMWVVECARRRVVLDPWQSVNFGLSMLGSILFWWRVSSPDGARHAGNYQTFGVPCKGCALW